MSEPTYGLVKTVQPATEPCTVAELCTHCRVTNTSEFPVVADFGVVAREYLEDRLGQTFMQTTYLMGVSRFPFGTTDMRWFWNAYGEIRVPRPPLQSVTSIVYVDSNGNTDTLSPSLYQVDTNRMPGRIAPIYTQVWPVVQYQTYNAVQITFVAGYTLLPRRIALALKMLTAHLYENREASIDVALNKIPFGLDQMIISCFHGEAG